VQGPIAIRSSHMLRWALIFVVVAFIALIFGFGGIAGLSMQIAWILFIVFLIFAALSFLFGRNTPAA
jgi:uncharacterized membrane protein YtjA (UPF0391 family)